MPSLQDFKAQLFRTLGSPVRIRVLEALRAAGSLTVGEIQHQIGPGPANVSQHLAVMRANGLLVTRRDGNNIWYSVPDPGLFDLLDAARGVFERQVEARNQVLDAADNP